MGAFQASTRDKEMKAKCWMVNRDDLALKSYLARQKGHQENKQTNKRIYFEEDTYYHC